MPEPRYFSMPSIDVGAEDFRNRALNCWPWVRSLTHSPDAVIHSPAAIVAAWPTMVTKSRWPRAFARRTQKPFSALWKVTRSTRPASTSWVDDSGWGFMRIGRSCNSLLRASIQASVARTYDRLNDVALDYPTPSRRVLQAQRCLDLNMTMRTGSELQQ